MSTTSNIFFSEYERLKTFHNGWPHSFLSAEAMAKCGFYYLGVNDEVKCPFCNVVVFNWSFGDEPIREHIRTSSRCRFINGYEVGNVFIGDDPRQIFNLTPGEDVCGSITSKNVESGKTDSNEPGIPFCEPSHLDFITYDSRLATYADWTSQNIAPAKLAEAGFFFRGVGTVEGIEIVDAVTCFHCGESLSGWTKDDNAWEEHAKFSPKCSFIFLLTAFEVSKKHQNAVFPTFLPYSWLSRATDEDPCSVCLEFSVSICFSPCQHSTCSICAAALLKCPICRSNIKRLIKISKEVTAVETLAIEKNEAEVDKTTSSQLVPTEEGVKEEEAREVAENDESTGVTDDSGLVTPSEDLETPSGFAPMTDEMQAPDDELRKSKIKDEMKSNERVLLDTIIREKKTERVPRTESSTDSTLFYDSKAETVAPSVDSINANALVDSSSTSVDDVPVEPGKPKESENVPVVPSASVSAEKKKKGKSKESDVVAKTEVKDGKKKEPVVAEVSEVAAAPIVTEVKPVATVSAPVSQPDSVTVQTSTEQPKKQSFQTQESTSICVN